MGFDWSGGRLDFLSIDRIQIHDGRYILMKMVLAIFFLFLSTHCWAQSDNANYSYLRSVSEDDGEGSFFTRVEFGYSLFSGAPDLSLAGASGYNFLLGREERNGFWRFHMAAGIDRIQGNTTFSDQDTTLSLTLFKAMAGIHFYLFSSGALQPFFGATGSYGKGAFTLTGAPEDLTAYFQPKSTGYELSVGADFKGSSDTAQKRGPYLRVRISWSRDMGAFADVVDGLIMDSFRLSIGI